MSENKQQQHHHFHHQKNENTHSEATPYEKAMKEEKHHKRMEHLGELGAVAAGTGDMGNFKILKYEKHKAKKDPENAHKHKVAEEIAATVAVGAGGYAFHEHHKKKEFRKEVKDHHF